MIIERVAVQQPAHRFTELRRVHPGTFPAGVDVIYGKDGNDAVVQAIHFHADTVDHLSAKQFLRDRGFHAALIVMRQRDMSPHDCWSCGQEYGWTVGCKRCQDRPKTLVSGLTGLKFERTKADEELQIAFGWFYVVERCPAAGGTQTVDFSKEVSTLKSLERAGYAYVLDSRKGGVMHQKSSDGTVIQVGRLAEFCVVTPEKRTLWGLDGLSHKMHLGIWGGMRIDDKDIWAQVKSGVLSEFSIAGWTTVTNLN